MIWAVAVLEIATSGAKIQGQRIIGTSFSSNRRYFMWRLKKGQWCQGFTPKMVHLGRHPYRDVSEYELSFCLVLKIQRRKQVLQTTIFFTYCWGLVCKICTLVYKSASFAIDCFRNLLSERKRRTDWCRLNLCMYLFYQQTLIITCLLNTPWDYKETKKELQGIDGGKGLQKRNCKVLQGFWLGFELDLGSGQGLRLGLKTNVKVSLSVPCSSLRSVQ